MTLDLVALREINDLEVRIAAANDDTDGALWRQAVIVASLLESGFSQRWLAERWINPRTGKGYTHRHVQVVAQVAGYLNSQPRPSFRTAYSRITNAGANRHHVGWTDLTDDVRREVRRIGVEMDVFQFVGHTFFDTGRGRGGDCGVVGGAAGAKVYWDIVGGDPKGGRPTCRYTRGQVTAKIGAFITKGVRSKVSDLVVDVARRRLAGDRSVSGPELPPSAGDATGRSIWLSAASVAKCELLALKLGTRDTEETIAAVIALVGLDLSDVQEKDDLPQCLRELTTPDYSDMTDACEEVLA